MQSTSKQTRPRSEPLVLDGRIVDGCVKLLGIEPKFRRGRIRFAAPTVLVAQLVAFVTQIAGRSLGTGPGGWRRA